MFGDKKRPQVGLKIRGNKINPSFVFNITNGRKVKGGVEADLTIEGAIEIATAINRGVFNLSSLAARRGK